MDGIETTGKALVEHWKWAAEKGLMNENTARALGAACAQVLGTLEDWQAADVRKINVEEVCRRFQNKRNKDFKPESLDAYKRRFAQALKSFLEYADDPSAWKPVAGDRTARKERDTRTNGGGAQLKQMPAEMQPAAAGAPALVEYPFPLREGRMARLTLPADLKLAEVRRLSAYLNTLAVDFEPESGA